MRTALLVVAVLVVPRSAAATTCPAPTGASAALASQEAEARLQFIRARLAAEVGPTRAWMGAWGGGYLVLTVAQLVLTPFLNDEDRKDFYVGAAASLVGLAAVVALPPAVLADQPALERTLAATPDVCAQLAAAEETLARDADDQRFARAWFFHLGNVVFNLGIGLVIGLGFTHPGSAFGAPDNHWTSAIVNAVVGAAVGEAMIFTTPWGLMGTNDRYRAGSLDQPKAGVQFKLLPMAVREGAGVLFALQF